MHRQHLHGGMWRLWAVVFLAIFSVADLHGEDIPLVVDGRSSAVIVLPPDAPAELKGAVDDLSQYIHQICGARIAVEPDSADGRLEIHVGQTGYVRSHNLTPMDLGEDGFKIAFPEHNRIVLIGGTDSGTEFAVREFTERYLGVRWLYPGEQGVYVPVAKDISIPDAEIVSKPAYISRTISTAVGNDTGQPVWLFLQRHRRHWTIQHHHNLNKLISPDEFYDSHPEFFPLIDGKRQKPEPEGYYWQPVLHAPGIVDASIAKINRFFDRNPRATSYSLGINDNNNFEDAPSEGINSVDAVDYSNYYFTYANAVADGVLKSHPDKWLGCLAYLGVTDPPKKTGVNPHIVPYICIDRYGWVSDEVAGRDRQRTQAWHKAAPTLGWYDYIYGDDMYRIPRIYNHLMGRYLKFGAENGVRAMYAEYYGDPDLWIDGPKLYVFMKLLWNPDADVDAMTSEWYRLAVGEQAAVPLAKYYDFWEDYWTKRVPRTDWFAQCAGRIYFDFTATGYLDELTEQDLQQCRRWIDQVVKLAQTPDQQARARHIADGFAGVLRNVEYVVNAGQSDAAPAGKKLIDDSFVPARGGAVDEKLPAPWAGWQHAPGTARFFWDHKTCCGDTHSLAIDLDHAGFHTVIHQELTVEKPAGMYYLSAAAQCTQVNADAYIGVEISWSRPDGKYLPAKYFGNRFYSGGLYKDGVWKPLSFYVRPPPVEGPLKMQIAMKVARGKHGVVHFDDLQLVEIDSR